MSTDAQYVSVREAAQLLGVSERKIMDLIEERKLTAYKIANQFLRLRKSDILDLRNTGKVVVETVQHPYSQSERMHDFFSYNDFYIFTGLIIIALLYIILYTS